MRSSFIIAAVAFSLLLLLFVGFYFPFDDKISLDGSFEDWAEYSEVAISNGSNEEGSIFFTYDSDNFYFYVKVYDDFPGIHRKIADKPWLGDSVELWLDFNNDPDVVCDLLSIDERTEECPFVDAYYFALASDNISRVHGMGTKGENIPEYEFAYAEVDGGYAIEVSVVRNFINGFNPSVRDDIGVALMINDLDSIPVYSGEVGDRVLGSLANDRVISWPDGYARGILGSFESVSLN